MLSLSRSAAGSARRLLAACGSAAAAVPCSRGAVRAAAPLLRSSCLQQSPLQQRACLSVRAGPASASKSTAREAYGGRASGQSGTADWRYHLLLGGKELSPWHDIPLLSPDSTSSQLLFHYVNEIPRGTRPKLEVATKEPGNPIKQDVKKGKLRDFTYGDLPFNYGLMPQTWEEPAHAHPLTLRGGDNDPLDVVELSDAPLPIGAVRSVKVLGIMALLDESETDWKVLAIDAAHPMAQHIRTADDLETHWPGKVDAVREWFRMYKTTDGKAVNEFAADGAVLPVGQANAIIWETHAAWAKLCRGEVKAEGLALPAQPSNAALGTEGQ